LCSTLKVILCDNLGNGIIGIIKSIFLQAINQEIKIIEI